MSTVLYFHGYGANAAGSAGSRGFINNLADRIIAFDAPIPVSDVPCGFKWFSLDIPVAEVRAELQDSVDFITGRIRGVDQSDLILFGNSQGGFMALYLALNNIISPKFVVAAVPFYHASMIHSDINKSVPILWMAAGRDEMIPADLGAMWQNLKAAGANIEYRADTGSSHCEWTPRFIEAIEGWVRSKSSQSLRGNDD